MKNAQLFTGLALVLVGLVGQGAIAKDTPAAPEKAAIASMLSNAKDWGICADSLDLGQAQRASKAYKLDNQSYLIVVNCFLAAYQGNYEFWIYTKSSTSQPIKQLLLTEYTEDSANKVGKVQSKSIGGLPAYDPKSRILKVQSKYRGLGDCGSVAKYRLEDGKFKLLEFRAKFQCDGKLEPLQKIYPR